MRVLVQNRKASHEYEILEKFEAGLVLEGYEVKPILNGSCSISEGYISFKGKEAYLKQVHVDKYNNSNPFEKVNEKRDRKLLLNKHELRKLQKGISEKGFSIIPLKIYYSKSRRIKIEIALCRGKKLYDRRHDLKKKQQDLETKRELKKF